MNGTNGTRHVVSTTIEFTYTLEKGSKKHFCPSCAKKRFVRYINVETGEYLPARYGRCDREVNCRYHLNPYQDAFEDESQISERAFKQTFSVCERKGQRVHVPFAILKRTLRTEAYSRNGFIQNLHNHVPFPFDDHDLERLIELYYLGTVTRGYMAGALTIPFINRSGNIRAIQVKKFDKRNHTTHTNWIHSLIRSHLDKNERPHPNWLTAYLENGKLIDCLFGEHLLADYPNNPIALVEAPKTALYGTFYFGFPDRPENFLWLAVFNLSSLTAEKCKVLRGRRVALFPDLSKGGHAYNQWFTKAYEIMEAMPGTRFTVSDLLERYAKASERKNGLDLADFLIKLDWREFRRE